MIETAQTSHMREEKKKRYAHRVATVSTAYTVHQYVCIALEFVLTFSILYWATGGCSVVLILSLLCIHIYVLLVLLPIAAAAADVVFVVAAAVVTVADVHILLIFFSRLSFHTYIIFCSYFHNSLCVLHLVTQSIVDIQAVRTSLDAQLNEGKREK